ncbi:putative enzyme related to lactoylglutathione lyase [Kitasatospora sp. MAA4]|uniref:VOC family protein n=1 Tax=Kitasatospora sp. MAA4 TaxID=3035093 RepID=UPI0024734F8A|nr:VOC family protein [Kitasatospora sp. MAA4]MDH6136037.1 putative enzyme related to lactoylglutathione lyase [Kitasatospora sp. MAA4]
MTAVKVRVAQGTPCWVSLVVHDLEGAEAFYGPLLDWSFTPGPAELGCYVRASLHGAKVAGIGLAPADSALPTEWTTYFAVDSADDVSQRVRECGGTVAVGPLQSGAAGRLAVAADLSGAFFGLWEGREHLGWEVVGEPGAPVWSELVTNDEPLAAAFYGSVLGRAVVEADPSALARGDEEATLQVDGHRVAGIRQTGDLRDGPPRWRVYFAVADVDPTVHQALALGGSLLVAPYDTPYGRVARLADPEGGRFSIVKLP